MYITKNLSGLKKKVKETFELKKDVKVFYYFEKNRKHNKKIYLRTEEDYQIMMMFMNNQKIIKLNFSKSDSNSSSSSNPLNSFSSSYSDSDSDSNSDSNLDSSSDSNSDSD